MGTRGVTDTRAAGAHAAAAPLRLLAPPAAPGPIVPSAEQRAVIDHRGGRLRVLAGPGTGKTTTLVEAVAARAERGIAVESILVLTFSRRAARDLADRIGRRLAVTTTEPVVRTLHSYAYALLRAQAARTGEPPPRLLAAGESDQMVRELLAGQALSGAPGWPVALRPALRSPAFAAELRDLMLRAAERGVTPARMAALGRAARRPEWIAAARFAKEYQDVADLRQASTGLGPALDQAELTGAALALLGSDRVLATEQARIRRVFVDEYQDVDPAQARLVELLAAGADEFVVVGDPDQSIYAFRGSDPAALRDVQVERTVALTLCRRMAPAVLDATRRTARALPGPGRHRALRPMGGAPEDSPGTAGGSFVAAAHGLVEIRLLPGPSQEAAYVADQLRRAHLHRGIPWSEMAVLARSPAAALPVLRRAFLVAGVPVIEGAADGSLTADPVVAALLAVLRVGIAPGDLDGETALRLLTSPLAALDPLALRRLRRALRAAWPDEGASGDLLAAALSGRDLPPDLPADLTRPIARLAAMITAARDGAGEPAAETVLWRVWQRSGLAAALDATALAGGRAGHRADATLDAVLGLFGAAGRMADGLPLAGVQAFVDSVESQQIPGDERPAPRHPDAVAVLSAHAAKGLEWDVVAVVGVQEGVWPDLRVRGSLLGTTQLLDTAAGVPREVSRTAQVLADERRLFYVAATRARHALIVTAVTGEDTAPSRFLTELAGTDDLPAGWPRDADGSRRRGLTLPELIAELRRNVADPASPRAGAAAESLARLAGAGIPGAHPGDWYGLAERSTDAPAVLPGHAVVVSPSAVESLTTCALRAVLERRGGRGGDTQASIEGTLVHALAAGLAAGIGIDELRAEIDRYLAAQDAVPGWIRRRTARALNLMLTNAQSWFRAGYPPRNVLGAEVDLQVDLGPGTEPNPVRIMGRADLLSAAADGSVVITDFKTTANVATKAEAAANPQLATYQLALRRGAAGGAEPGGAELVFLRGTAATVRPQPPLRPDAVAAAEQAARAAAAQLAASAVWAQENKHCPRCPVRSSCPLQPEGRQVTG